MQLAFPGLMCLFPSSTPPSSMLWRVCFGVTSAAAVLLLVALNRRPVGRWARADEVGNWVAAALFAGIAVVAISPDRRRGGVGGAPAWMMLFAKAQDTT